MDKEEIQSELDKVAHRLAELTVEIMKLEKCFGVRVDMDVTTILGAAQVTVNVKTSGAGSLEVAVKIAEDLGIDTSGIPGGGNEPTLKPEDEVNDVLAQVLKKKMGGTSDGTN